MAFAELVEAVKHAATRGDVIDVAEASFAPPPPTLTGAARAVISGVCKLEKQLLLLLDVRRTLDIASEIAHP